MIWEVRYVAQSTYRDAALGVEFASWVCVLKLTKKEWAHERYPAPRQSGPSLLPEMSQASRIE